MIFSSYKTSFDRLMGVKDLPNQHELYLIKRAKRYIGKITWVPGVRMIAIVNSLSMNATHKGSDIDLFIVTKKDRMWIARLCITFIFWMEGVWRRNDEIAGNFCLSFWIEETAMNMAKIAIKDDIYLAYWMYYMKPVLTDETIWQEFVRINPGFHFDSNVDASLIYRKKNLTQSFISRKILDAINYGIRFFGERRTKNTYKKKKKPEGVIIKSDILKFHDKDARQMIREKILGLE